MKREMKRMKNYGVILVLSKSEERNEKRVVFVLTAVFERARNCCVKKFSLSERNFFVHVWHFKAVFSFILVKRFGYDFFLILGWFQ